MPSNSFLSSAEYIFFSEDPEELRAGELIFSVVDGDCSSFALFIRELETLVGESLFFVGDCMVDRISKRFLSRTGIIRSPNADLEEKLTI